jgi:cytochrome c
MGDVANGKNLFMKLCATCHTTEKNGKHKIGPNLHDIIGKASGSKYIKRNWFDQK